MSLPQGTGRLSNLHKLNRCRSYQYLEQRRKIRHFLPSAYCSSEDRSMGWTTLVIDDDPGSRQSLRLCLEVSGARVLGVATAEAALAALDRGQFDVVFLDLWLGSESGLAALPEI